MVLGRPGWTLVVAWMTPSAPLAKRRQATAVSSTSMRSWASVAVKPLTCVTGAHHPQQQIDVVDRLVHQRAAAVERLVPFQPPSS